jgi:hypothetical protein
MPNKAMWDWMDKAEGKKEGSSFEGMNKERERQGYKKVSSPAKSNAIEKKKHAIKNLYKMGVKNVGEEKTKQGLRTAFNHKR